VSRDVKVPDLGDFKDVEVIDVLVKPGDAVAVDTPLITLETEKATTDVPSPAAGVIAEITVRKGDRVNTGSLIARLTAEAAGAAAEPARPSAEPAPSTAVPAAPPVAQQAAEEDTARRQALREAEPFGGEPYMDTVPIAPLDRGGKVPADGATPSRDESPAAKPGQPAADSATYDCRGSRPQGCARRAHAPARWRVPQRRLHPLEGPAARGAGHRGSERDGTARHRLRPAGHRCRAPA
jgi:pyruvate/2-oxoglutarate dehydrogenase complex dihydrolipoamide acyltransferase (E2) component